MVVTNLLPTQAAACVERQRCKTVPELRRKNNFNILSTKERILNHMLLYIGSDQKEMGPTPLKKILCTYTLSTKLIETKCN